MDVPLGRGSPWKVTLLLSPGQGLPGRGPGGRGRAAEREWAHPINRTLREEQKSRRKKEEGNPFARRPRPQTVVFSPCGRELEGSQWEGTHSTLQDSLVGSGKARHTLAV